MAEEAKWYVVHTYSGYENKVADSIVNAVENRQLHHLIYRCEDPDRNGGRDQGRRTKGGKGADSSSPAMYLSR